ncbi:hypothetical protein R6Z07M_019314 [Ovis aries]
MHVRKGTELGRVQMPPGSNQGVKTKGPPQYSTTPTGPHDGLVNKSLPRSTRQVNLSAPEPGAAAVSLFSDVTQRPRPSTPIPAPGLRLLAPETQQPLKPRQSKAPPAARPGLRPLALSPTCLCYSSSLPRLASNTAADWKTRSAEPPLHLESEAGAGPKPPQLARGGECARARVFVSNPGCAGADYDLGLRRAAAGARESDRPGGGQRPGGRASEQRRRSAVTPAPVGAEQKPARSPSRRPRSSSRPEPALPGSGGCGSGASSSGSSGARSTGTCIRSAQPGWTAGATASFPCDCLFLTPLAASSPSGQQRPWQDQKEEARWTNAARGVRIRAAVHHSPARARKENGAGVRRRNRQLLTGTWDAGDSRVTEPLSRPHRTLAAGRVLSCSSTVLPPPRRYHLSPACTFLLRLLLPPEPLALLL